eukprot:gnl/TRDRNA2_/TRDRNA2_175986_c0_seq1.p1 gnl/TRDRNA2_/TRDRNA2_175986_c0~~gnl/TRDRNA2_/TRDRNA2_175986_c0_seq1.p1  ORF type:complete len:331 (-),score=24.50 gnl/TRDRNA2_/TRDRNA2_175986_c0_seq1:97-963(-)
MVESVQLAAVQQSALIVGDGGTDDIGAEGIRSSSACLGLSENVNCHSVESEQFSSPTCAASPTGSNACDEVISAGIGGEVDNCELSPTFGPDRSCSSTRASASLWIDCSVEDHATTVMACTDSSMRRECTTSTGQTLGCTGELLESDTSSNDLDWPLESAGDSEARANGDIDQGACHHRIDEDCNGASSPPDNRVQADCQSSTSSDSGTPHLKEPATADGSQIHVEALDVPRLTDADEVAADLEVLPPSSWAGHFARDRKRNLVAADLEMLSPSSWAGRFASVRKHTF